MVLLVVKEGASGVTLLNADGQGADKPPLFPWRGTEGQLFLQAAKALIVHDLHR